MKPQSAKPKPPLEKDVQRAITTYLQLKGWTVWRTSQGYRKERGGTRMSPGIPDLYCLHPKQGAMWVEVKRPGGKVREAQDMFINLHQEARAMNDVPPVYVWYSLEDCRKALEP